MKLGIILGLALLAITLGSLGAAPNAYAGVITNHSGTICKNLRYNDATYIDYQPNGTRSLAPYRTYVICPLTRNTMNSGGALVWVDITHPGPETTTCTASSYTYTGTLIASNTQSWTGGGGSHEFSLNLVGAGKSDAYSDYSVLCFIPAQGAGSINGVDVYEQ